MAELIVKEHPNPLSEKECSPKERMRQLKEQEERERMAREREKKSIYHDFAQLNKKAIPNIIKASQENPKACQVLLFILMHMDKLNALVCSYQVFQERLGLSQATVARAIKYLKQNGMIAVLRSGSSNVYIANPDIAWTSSGDKVKYCQFPANVVLSSSEQEKFSQVDFDRMKVLKESESKERRNGNETGYRQNTV